MFTDDLKRGVEKLAILDAAPERGKSGTVSPLQSGEGRRKGAMRVAVAHPRGKVDAK
jgi:hypothetical protein